MTRVYYYRAGSAASWFAPDDLSPEYISQARYLHLTGITPALSIECRQTLYRAIDIARDADIPISFDPNVRLTLWMADEAREALRGIIPHVQIVLTSREEATLLTGASDPETAARLLLDRGPSQVIVKLGSNGALG